MLASFGAQKKTNVPVGAIAFRVQYPNSFVVAMAWHANIRFAAAQFGGQSQKPAYL
ncbi:hypothetical protein [Flavilitoribacter nigricans]|uniref:hypothetical protein n=1 Tax=Flavilitoribacter nigricans TaxID=70997 RepID=UPI0014765603|nr:hypothetical protein [Flavilitoribacter nigricans]